jgi:hypothetical protein
MLVIGGIAPLYAALMVFVKWLKAKSQKEIDQRKA